MRAKFQHAQLDLSVRLISIAFLVASACLSGLAQDAKKAGNSPKSGASNIERGKYVVEGLAVCAQCHTPRTSAGDLDRSKWLQGAPVWMRPAEPSTDWPLQAPRIAGTPPGSDAEMITLLTTGLWRNGKPLRPPMPQFRMSRQDAEAVVAYLRSLSPSVY
jgi:mono/diheme cytochrome c family protein